ncbi:Kelch-like protein 40a [Pseudocercospora fuligena]|uniref:Kelch-like protein 40a n=1 Tax=Pseudocercospora fuligena TaxID=685502 RepID=A0A8H6R954_9PEZI|nr:Kelch-like protein 40a [Pseudocercospora fuligena]
MPLLGMSNTINIKAASATAKHPASDYVGNTKEFFDTNTFSDITFICGDKEFKLHRIVLATQSRVFAKLLMGDFREATSGQRSIPLPDDDPAAMSAVFKYMYNFSWDPLAGEEGVPESVFTVKVFAAGDKYELPALTSVAARRFNKVADPAIDLAGFIQAIYAVDEFTAGENGLWKVLLPKIKTHITSLLACPDFVELVHSKKELTMKLLGQLDPSKNKTFEPAAAHTRPVKYESSSSSSSSSDSEMDDEGEDEDGFFQDESHAFGGGGSRFGVGRRLG